MSVASFIRFHARWLIPMRAQIRMREVVPAIPTMRSRVDPTFLVIGAQRAGTSSLFAALSAHPQVLPPALKELHHFDHDRPWPHALYRCHFPRRSTMEARAREVGGPVITGEATPDYLFHPEAPERVAEALPDARLIVLLREPVERAWSHLRMLNEREWLDERSLRAAVLYGSTTLGGRRRAREHWTRPYGRFALYERGLYAEQLARWFEYFPREQFHIVRSADLFGSPQLVYDEICRFVGIEPGFTLNPIHLNQGPEMPVPLEDARWLAERYAEPNRALEELVGITWDGTPAPPSGTPRHR